ncbi:unnamed protein product [Caenorhabditis angaria]|uniref:Uncharacterized protein n=1 Tax=Caenorhabditis angaria TaxID=860376 RepID=A0A9P1J1K1_9PELO|nr:unnamed protein product [Caenorhabditis angaria]
MYMSVKLRIFLRRYRLVFCIFLFVTLFLIIKTTRHSNHNKLSASPKVLSGLIHETFKSKESRLLRLSQIKWQKCMLELIDEHQLTLEDLDPLDPRFGELQEAVRQNQEKKKKHKLLEDYDDERFETMWAGLNGYAKNCWQKTDMWHIEPNFIPSTRIGYILPYSDKIPITVVRIANNNNDQIQSTLRENLSKETAFFEISTDPGASKKYTSSIGKHVTLKIDMESEYEIMEAFRKDGLLDKSGITVCQINILYSRPTRPDDSKKEEFRKHIVRFIREGKYTLLMASNYLSQRVFWVNTQSIECQQRYLEKNFSNDVDFV